MKSVRFLVGMALGAFAVYWWVHYYGATRQAGERWFGDKASAYRGDKRHEQAGEALR